MRMAKEVPHSVPNTKEHRHEPVGPPTVVLGAELFVCKCGIGGYHSEQRRKEGKDWIVWCED